MTSFRCADGTLPSQLGVGTVALGLARGDTVLPAQRAIAVAIELGITLFDTAPLYGRGLAEIRLGEVLSCASRERLFITSKVGRPIPLDHVGADQSYQPSFNYSYQSTLDQVSASLDRLRLDRLDAVMIHDIGARTHGDSHGDRLAEAMSGAYLALKDLQSAGVVGCIGIGANEAEVMIEASALSGFDLFLVAGRYTLLDHGLAMKALLEMTASSSTSVILGGVFNSGVLATGSRGGRFDYRPASAEILARTASIEAVCEAHRVALPAAALQFALRAPGSPSILIGPANDHELRANLEFAREPIAPDFWSDLRQENLIPSD